MTLSAWAAKYIAEECDLSLTSMRSKRNAQARVEEYLLHIDKPEYRNISLTIRAGIPPEHWRLRQVRNYI